MIGDSCQENVSYPESYPDNEEEVDDDCSDISETQLHDVFLKYP